MTAGNTLGRRHSFYVFLFEFTAHLALEDVPHSHSFQIGVIDILDYQGIFLKDFPLMGMKLGAEPFPE
jgi:hypothetical protein